MLKVKFEVRFFQPGFCFEFNLLKWQFGFVAEENQYAKYFKMHVGPLNVGFLWDKDVFN
jgi:hypothetical protein